MADSILCMEQVEVEGVAPPHRGAAAVQRDGPTPRSKLALQGFGRIIYVLFGVEALASGSDLVKVIGLRLQIGYGYGLGARLEEHVASTVLTT